MNHIFASGEGLNGGQVVPLTTLDDICRNHAPFLAKVDIEGFELEAMRGALELLTRKRPAAWVLESNHCAARYDASRADLVALISSFGGSVCQYDPDRRQMREIRDDDANIIAIIDHDAIRTRLQRGS